VFDLKTSTIITYLNRWYCCFSYKYIHIEILSSSRDQSLYKKYRGMTEIIALILKAANQRDDILKICCNHTTSKQFYDYLQFLLTDDLLEYSAHKWRSYRITRSGRRFWQLDLGNRPVKKVQWLCPQPQPPIFSWPCDWFSEHDGQIVVPVSVSDMNITPHEVHFDFWTPCIKL
jgi:predicted transcriptional regulator